MRVRSGASAAAGQADATAALTGKVDWTITSNSVWAGEPAVVAEGTTPPAYELEPTPRDRIRLVDEGMIQAKVAYCVRAARIRGELPPALQIAVRALVRPDGRVECAVADVIPTERVDIAACIESYVEARPLRAFESVRVAQMDPRKIVPMSLSRTEKDRAVQDPGRNPARE